MHKAPYPTIVDGHMIVLRGNEKIAPRYLGYALKAQQATVLQLDEGSTGQTELNRDRLLAEIEISYPVSLDEQKAIADTLSAFDARIAANKAINHRLEQMAQAIFKSWFVDFEPFGGVMPEDWRDSTIGMVCNVKGGKRLPKGENLITTPNTHPYVRVRDMNESLFLQMTSTIEYVPDEIYTGISRYIVSANDVIISIVGTIGLVCIVHGSLNKASLTENCVKLTNCTEVTPLWLYLFLSSEGGQEQIRNVTVGAVQPKLPIKNIQSIPFALPPLNTMEEFNGLVSGLFEAIANNCDENTRLANIRDTLLPRLMSGELSIANI
jgi:type I restriction enzyme S subunit